MSDEIDPRQASALYLCRRHSFVVQQMCPDESIGGAHIYRLFVERNMEHGAFRSAAQLVAWCKLLHEGCPVCFDWDADEMLVCIWRAYQRTERSLSRQRERVIGWRVSKLDHLPGAKGSVWLVKIGSSAAQVKTTPELVGANCYWWN